MSTHFHYGVQCYEEYNRDTWELYDIAYAELRSVSEVAALRRATHVVAKKYYRVSKVIEHAPTFEDRNGVPHLHYIVQAYNGMNGETGELLDYTTIEIISVNEKQAIEKAKSLVSKGTYRIMSVIEHVPNEEDGLSVEGLPYRHEG